jgi:hypothetical protein
MPDRRRRGAAVLGLVAALLVVAALPATTFAASAGRQPTAHLTIADAPPGQHEDCVDDPAAHPGVGLQKCETPFSVASLLPFVAGGIIVLLAIAAGWYLVMRRRASRPFLPDTAVTGAGAVAGGRAAGGPGSTAPSDEWWTCRNCGATNMVGVARCYKCGAWPR